MRTTLTLALLALCLAIAQAEEGVIRIVSSLPRTGSAKGQTDSMANGIRMAVEEIGGTILGMKLEYLDWDDASPERGAWDPAVEQANAAKAIQDQDVLVYIGTYNSGAAKVVMADLNKAGLAMISPANTAVGLTKPGKAEPNEPDIYRPSKQVTYFRVVPADDIQGSQGASWAKQLGATKVFVLHDRELYGEGLAKVFTSEAGRMGLEVVGYEGINPKDANYRALMVKVKATGAELVYFGGTTQTNAGQLAKDLVASGSEAKFMVPDGCFENAFIEAAGAATLEGRGYITFGGVPPEELTGKGRIFVEAYQAKFGAMPEAYAIYAYEAAKVALDAIARAGTKDRAKVVAALRATAGFEGALGTWSFDANGDTSLTLLSGNTVKDGKFAFVKLLGDGPDASAASTPNGNPSTAGPAPAATPTVSQDAKPTPVGLLVVAGVVVLVIVVLLLKKPKGG